MFRLFLFTFLSVAGEGFDVFEDVLFLGDDVDAGFAGFRARFDELVYFDGEPAFFEFVDGGDLPLA